MSEGKKELAWARSEIFALCEDTETKCHLEAEGGDAFARGRVFEAKGIRRAMGEVIAERLRATPQPAMKAGEEDELLAQIRKQIAVSEFAGSHYDKQVLTVLEPAKIEIESLRAQLASARAQLDSVSGYAETTETALASVRKALDELEPLTDDWTHNWSGDSTRHEVVLYVQRRIAKFLQDTRAALPPEDTNK